MIRSLFFLLKIGLLITAIVLVASYPGTVQIEWENYTLKTSTAILALFGAGLCIIVYFLSHFFWSLRRLPANLLNVFRFRSLDSLETTLRRALESYRSGDTRRLRRDLVRLADQVEDPVLEGYFWGKGEQLKGKSTVKIFTHVAQTPSGKFMGNRELADIYKDKNQREKAFTHTLKAYEADQKSPWAVKALIDYYREQNDLKEAHTILGQAHKNRVLDQRAYNALQAQIWYEQSKAEKDEKEAIRLLEMAVDACPGLIPAVEALAKYYAQAEKWGIMESIIEEAWRLCPHDSLVPYYTTNEKDPLEVVQTLEDLVKKNPDHPTSLRIMAIAYLEAELWGKARNSLSKIMDKDLTPKVCFLWADLERQEYGNHKEAERWIEKITTLPCGSCAPYTPCHPDLNP